ncbi:MAG: TonB-dependent receptor, partial [Rhodospirillales bacterium]|nr:TonB-dependent receptor [Rhodospirillales bacterium]
MESHWDRHGSTPTEDESKRWTARRKAALVLEIIQAKTTVAEASRSYDLPPSETELWVEDGKRGMENALRANPEIAREQYERQLKDLQERTAPGMRTPAEAFALAAWGEQVPLGHYTHPRTHELCLAACGGGEMKHLQELCHTQFDHPMLAGIRRCAPTIWLIVTCGIAASSPAVAQTQSASTKSDDNQLPEIVVTAQKRPENIKDAPLSVTAFTGSALTAAGITAVRDLGEIDSTLQFSAIGGIATVFMRGLGNPVATVGNEASVPMYIDDVYYSRLSPSFFDLVNVDNVEILTGPQGTLFGRNASAGLISIYTRDPGNSPVIEGMVGYGNYATTTAQLYASVPITDKLAADISLSEYNQASGWGRNVYNADQTYLNYSYNARSKVIWKPTDSTTVKFIGYYVEQNSLQGVLTTPYAGTVGGGVDNSGTITVPPQPPQPRFYDIKLDHMPGVRSQTYGGSIRVDQELGFGVFSSISAARKTNESYLSDGDLTPYP